jgi:hypothetical protein
MNPFSLAIPFAIISPALVVGGFAYFWRSLLPHFWWFIGIGAVASYVLMAVCLACALSNVGITGDHAATLDPALDPLTIRYLAFMLGWLMGSAMILYLTRYLLSKI